MKNQKAFTLIELLITIVIVGILAGVGGFRYFSATEQARFNNSFDEIVKVVRQARNMAINSEMINSKTPDYFEVQLLSTGLTLKGYDTSDPPVPADYIGYSIPTAYNLVLPTGIKKDITGTDQSIDSTKYFSIKYSAPFGDLKIEFNNSTYETASLDVSFKKGSAEKKFTINKVAGTVEMK